MNARRAFLAAICVGAVSSACAPIAVSHAFDATRERVMLSALRSVELIDEERSGSIGILVRQDGAIEHLIKYSPAYLSGIRRGHVIVSIDGANISAIDGQRALIGKPGSIVELIVVDNGESETLRIERVAWWSLVNEDHVPPGSMEIDKRPGY